MPRRTTIRTVAVALLLSAAVAAAQSGSARTSKEWKGAVDAHTSGRLDAALREIAPWSFDEVMAAIDKTELDDRQRIRALVLHTDLAIVQRTNESAVRQRNASALIRDGRGYGMGVLSWHWDVARRLARAASADAREGIVRAWFDATCALFLEWADYGELTRHLVAAGPWRTRHAELLLYDGTLHQAYADPRVQSFLAPRRPRGPGGEFAATAYRQQREARRRLDDGTEKPVGDDPPLVDEKTPRAVPNPGTPADASRERQQAEALLRQALALDAGLQEARIRLAHVLIDQARHDEAAPLLREALASSLPPLLEYYGALLLGRVDEARGDFPAARSAFERAARLFPGAQTPSIALSRLAVVDGRSDDALSSLVEGIGEVAAPPVDPWWAYLRLRHPDAKARLESFFDGARR